MYGSTSSVTEWFHTGIVCHNMLSTHPQWTVSSRDRTHIGTIWTSKADELPGPSTIKFKFKLSWQLFSQWNLKNSPPHPSLGSRARCACVSYTYRVRQVEVSFARRCDRTYYRIFSITYVGTRTLFCRTLSSLYDENILCKLLRTKVHKSQHRICHSFSKMQTIKTTCRGLVQVLVTVTHKRCR